ncbi:ABC transporter ATP-binding protein [bacterium]|nr:MAG: ABC transporter ATP-binding protein [bacterium]
MRTFYRLKKYIIRYKWYYIFGFFLLIIVDGLQLVIPQVIRRAIDDLTYFRATPGGILTYVFAILAIAVGMGIARFGWRYFIIGNSRRIEREIRNEFYQHTQSLPVDFFNRSKTGDIMALATNDLDAVRMMLGMAIIAATDSLVLSIASLAMLLSISPGLTLYALIPLPALSVLILVFGKVLQERFRLVQETFATLTDKVREIFSGIRVVKAYVQEGADAEEFKGVSKRYVKRNLSLVRIWGLFDPLIGLIIQTAFVITILVGGRKVIAGTLSMGSLVAFSTYLGILAWPMIAVGWVINLYQRGKASMKRINKLFDEKPEVLEPENPVPLKEVRGKIEFKNFSFRYPEKSEPALSDISLVIPENSSVAVVGRTASGKTTLVSQISHIFTIPDGMLFIDDVDINRISLKLLRKNIGFVPQDPFLFSDTVFHNISFGVENATLEDAIYFAKLAGIHQEIMDFPEGYHTVVGERGVTLSGGQKQRITIARAMLINPRILILDDALSSVDTQKETEILANLRGFRKKRTTIIISHRISSVKDVDRIFVLDRGKLVQEGKHEELIKEEGIYRTIYEKQQLETELEKRDD